MPDGLLQVFRQKHPEYQDMPDAQVFMNLADPAKFKQAFPEYADLDDHTIGKNVAAEAGKVTSTDKGWLRTAASDLGSMASGVANQLVTSPLQALASPVNWLKQKKQEIRNQSEQLQKDIAARKAEGRSPAYRALAGTVEATGAFNPRPMEEAANRGATGEVIGHTVPPVALAVAPLVAEGAWAGGKAVAEGINETAMETPEVAAQRLLPTKSKNAAKFQRNLAGGKPFLEGPEDLKALQERIPVAQNEVFQDYNAAIQRVGNKPIQGPNGLTTLSKLEFERKALVADLDGFFGKQPTEQALILRKHGAEGIRDLIIKRKAIEAILDPELNAQGVNSKLVRRTWGNLQGLKKVVEGRNTLTESAPSGIGKLTSGATAIETGAGAAVGATIGGGAGAIPGGFAGAITSLITEGGLRDILAGRGWWKMKPTDVAVKEGFRNPAPRPDLTTPIPPTVQGPQVRGQIGPGPMITPYPSLTSVTSTPPFMSPTSRAQRLGLLLPENVPVKSQIATGYTEPAAPGAVSYGEMPRTAPSSVPGVEPPVPAEANFRLVRDPKTGRMKKQFLESGGGKVVREEPVSAAAKPVTIPLERDPKTGRMLSRNRFSEQGPETSAFQTPGQQGIAKVRRQTLEPEITTDSMGVKWAEGPNGVRVSIPKRIPESEVAAYAKAKLTEQEAGQAAVKAQELTPAEQGEAAARQENAPANKFFGPEAQSIKIHESVSSANELIKNIPLEHLSGLKAVKPEFGGARYYGNTIHIDPEMLADTPTVFLHEVAHHVYRQLSPEALKEWIQIYKEGEKWRRASGAGEIREAENPNEFLAGIYAEWEKGTPNDWLQGLPKAQSFMQRLFGKPNEMLKPPPANKFAGLEAQSKAGAQRNIITLGSNDRNIYEKGNGPGSEMLEGMPEGMTAHEVRVNGKRVADAYLYPLPDGKTIVLDFIGDTPGMRNDQFAYAKNKLGVSGMRSVFSEIKRLYPNTERVQYTHAGGLSGENLGSKGINVPIEKLANKLLANKFSGPERRVLSAQEGGNVYSRRANERPATMGGAEGPALEPAEHARAEAIAGMKLTDQQAKNFLHRDLTAKLAGEKGGIDPVAEARAAKAESPKSISELFDETDPNKEDDHVVDVISRNYKEPTITMDYGKRGGKKEVLRGVKLPFDLEVYHGSQTPIKNVLVPRSTNVLGAKSTNLTTGEAALSYSEPKEFGKSKWSGNIYRVIIPKGEYIFTGGPGEAADHIRVFKNFKIGKTWNAGEFNEYEK